MGHLIYGHSEVVFDFDDRTLAHLQVVIGSKLRRDENFFMSWHDSFDSGGGRSSLWIDTSIPLVFKYTSRRAEKINPEWLELLGRTAGSTSGLQILDEPVRAVQLVE
jgi:hypothetical protein